jgi:hypothetical protein
LELQDNLSNVYYSEPFEFLEDYTYVTPAEPPEIVKYEDADDFYNTTAFDAKMKFVVDRKDNIILLAGVVFSETANPEFDTAAFHVELTIPEGNLFEQSINLELIVSSINEKYKTYYCRPFIRYHDENNAYAYAYGEDRVMFVGGNINEFHVPIYTTEFWSSQPGYIMKFNWSEKTYNNGSNLTYIYPNGDIANRSPFGYLYQFDTIKNANFAPVNCRPMNYTDWANVIIDFGITSGDELREPNPPAGQVFWDDGADCLNTAKLYFRGAGYGTGNPDVDDYYDFTVTANISAIDGATDKVIQVTSGTSSITFPEIVNAAVSVRMVIEL